ncbi:hypothetical protein EVG20_g8325 [Dentipellis fragilis]|uniref:Uncharacterized protein n=1 Tax=Dentipellis fragilis TaxID=205917 RepID=A0A4Y9Y967_9AGAM|nr:hypothetical protein EVG20_g8325 [Dentipellis fragilis]
METKETGKVIIYYLDLRVEDLQGGRPTDFITVSLDTTCEALADNIAGRLGCDPFMLYQPTDEVEGRLKDNLTSTLRTLEQCDCSVWLVEHATPLDYMMHLTISEIFPNIHGDGPVVHIIIPPTRSRVRREDDHVDQLPICGPFQEAIAAAEKNNSPSQGAKIKNYQPKQSDTTTALYDG